MEPPTTVSYLQAGTHTPIFASAGLVTSLRPQQWVKNGFVFAALIFSRSITDWHRNARVTAGALLFCLISSAVYLFNDILDAGGAYTGGAYVTTPFGVMYAPLLIERGADMPKNGWSAPPVGVVWRRPNSLSFLTELAFAYFAEAAQAIQSEWLRRPLQHFG